MKRKKLYPGTKEAEKQRGKTSFETQCIDNEPDIIRTAAGYCPNYKKFDRLGYSTERALVLCNMD